MYYIPMRMESFVRAGKNMGAGPDEINPVAKLTQCAPRSTGTDTERIFSREGIRESVLYAACCLAVLLDRGPN